MRGRGVTSAEAITEQARAIRPVRTVLSWVAALLFAIGWVTAQVLLALWFVCAWTFVAAREGWRTAKLSHEPGRPSQ